MPHITTVHLTEPNGPNLFPFLIKNSHFRSNIQYPMHFLKMNTSVIEIPPNSDVDVRDSAEILAVTGPQEFFGYCLGFSKPDVSFCDASVSISIKDGELLFEWLPLTGGRC